MRAVFGIVSLLVVLAVVGVVASRQLKATSQATALSDAASSAPAATVPGQARQTQEQVRQDVQKAFDQAARRNDAADK